MSAIAGELVGIKKELLQALAQIATLADEVGMSSLSKDLRGTRLPKLGAERFALRRLGGTPGVNDINEQRAEITYGYIPRADAVLFLLDGAQVLKQSERAFLEQRILRRSKDKLIFILGKIDLLSPEERLEALKYCRENLARVVEEQQIFPISAKRQLSEKPEEREQSGFVPLLAHLRKYLADERGRVLLDNGVADGLRTGGYLASNLGIKRR